jgi:hypothetical protein
MHVGAKLRHALLYGRPHHERKPQQKIDVVAVAVSHRVMDTCQL